MLVGNIQRDPICVPYLSRRRRRAARRNIARRTIGRKNMPDSKHSSGTRSPVPLLRSSFNRIDEIYEGSTTCTSRNAQSENQCRMSTSELGQHWFPFSITCARSDSAGVSKNVPTTIQPCLTRICACYLFVLPSGSEMAETSDQSIESVTRPTPMRWSRLSSAQGRESRQHEDAMLCGKVARRNRSIAGAMEKNESELSTCTFNSQVNSEAVRKSDHLEIK